MTIMESLLNGKKKQILFIGPKETVFGALTLMAEKDIGALMVMDGIAAVGIFSERDYARKVILKGKTSRETAVEEVMTPVTGMYGVKPDSTVEEAMALMTSKKVRHLPVFDGHDVIGVISIGDVLKSIIKYKDIEIKHLNNYIAGPYA
jgi:CBS domain-containing protein